MRKAKAPAPPTAPIDWPRADPQALAQFDPDSKRCTMNCGPAAGDPRSRAERLLLCDDCECLDPIVVDDAVEELRGPMRELYDKGFAHGYACGRESVPVAGFVQADIVEELRKALPWVALETTKAMRVYQWERCRELLERLVQHAQG